MKSALLLAPIIAVAALLGGGLRAHAQSADALIDKLVEKGILTVGEANELREESDQNFTTAHAVKTGMPDWVDALRINGDVRVRYESFTYDNPGTVDRNRFRYRARLGFVATMRDNLEAGLRLTSSEPTGAFGGDPISGNTTFGDNAAKKSVYLDLGYVRWSPLISPDWSGVFTAGKMENPFLFASSMMFDRDYTPEGAAFDLTHRFNAKQSLKLTGGAFVLDELSGDSNDPYVVGGQLRWEALWSQHWSSVMGVSAWTLANRGNLTNGAIPNVGGGNTRSAGVGALVHNYQPVQADLAITRLLDRFPFYKGPCPVTLHAEIIHNTAVSRRNDAYAAGITIGRSGRRGLWDVGYQYRHFEGDAWFEEFTESDFGANYVTAPTGGSAGYRSGANVRGHIFRAQYSPTDALTLGMTFALTELIEEPSSGSDSGTGRLQLDAGLRF